LLCLTCLFGTGVVRGEAVGREVPVTPTLLVSLVEALPLASPEDRSIFAESALQEMVAAYETALEPDHRVGASESRAARQRSWSYAAEAYLGYLRRVLDTVQQGAPVEVQLDGRRSVQLLVGDEPIIVTGPNLDHPEAMERRIADRYCAEASCPSDVAEFVRIELPPKRVWSFGDDRAATLSTADGIHCRFRNASERRLKEQTCLNLVGEMGALAGALRDARSAGFTVDWGGLRVPPAQGGELSRVVLNPRGDYVRLALPTVSRLGAWPPEASDWLRYRSADRTYQWVLEDADGLLGIAAGESN
jgi:hypothetical protein